MGKTVFERHERQETLGLSGRERDVLELMASGATNPEIAERLGLSPHTVRQYVKTLFRVYRVHSRAQLIAQLRNARIPHRGELSESRSSRTLT